MAVLNLFLSASSQPVLSCITTLTRVWKLKGADASGQWRTHTSQHYRRTIDLCAQSRRFGPELWERLLFPVTGGNEGRSVECVKARLIHSTEPRNTRHRVSKSQLCKSPFGPQLGVQIPKTIWDDTNSCPYIVILRSWCRIDVKVWHYLLAEWMRSASYVTLN